MHAELLTVSLNKTVMYKEYGFLCGKCNANYHLGTAFFLHKGILSLVTGEEFVSDTIKTKAGKPKDSSLWRFKRSWENN